MCNYVIASQKGGSGKTTIARNLVVALGSAGLIDLDPQQSLTRWFSKREGDGVELVEGVTFDKLPQAIKALKRASCKNIIIDTPPSDHPWMRGVFEQASIVLLPVKPTADDLRAIGPTLDMADALGVPFISILNQVPARSRLTEEAARTLAGRGKVAPIYVGNRVAYPETSSTGQGVTEYMDKKAATEITELAKYVNQQIRK